MSNEDETKLVLSISSNEVEGEVPIKVQMETLGSAVNGHDAFVAMFAGVGIVTEEVIDAAIGRYFPDLDDETRKRWYEALVLPISETLGATYSAMNETINMIMDVIGRGDTETVEGLVNAIMTGYDVEVTDDDGESKSGD